MENRIERRRTKKRNNFRSRESDPHLDFLAELRVCGVLSPPELVPEGLDGLVLARPSQHRLDELLDLGLLRDDLVGQLEEDEVAPALLDRVAEGGAASAQQPVDLETDL